MEEGKQKETYKRGEKKTRHARGKHFRRQIQNNLEIKKNHHTIAGDKNKNYLYVRLRLNIIVI